MDPSLDTEDRILQAARALLEEGGPAAVTTRAVAQRAGVNEVTLFRHFGTKERLVHAMVDHALVQMDAAPVTALDPSLPLVEDLAEWARRYFDHTLPLAHVLLLSLYETFGRPDVLPWHIQFRDRLPDALTHHLERLAAAGRVRPQGLRDVASEFYAALFAHVLSWHIGGDQEVRVISGRLARVFAASLDPRLARAEPDER